MGMTPVQPFESFFEGNLLDCHDAPGDIRRDFNAAVAVSHFAEQYFKYNKRHKSKLVSSYDTIGFFIDYLESQTNGAFREIQSQIRQFIQRPGKGVNGNEKCTTQITW